MLASVLFNVQSLQAGAFTHLASFPLCSRRLTMTSQGMRAAQEREATLARELEADTAVSARAERLAATPAEFVLSCTIPTEGTHTTVVCIVAAPGERCRSKNLS